MQIHCKTMDLLEAVNTVQKAVSSKTNMQILDGILLECQDTIKLTGYNTEIGIEYFLEGDIKSTGSIVLNARILGDIIRKLPDGVVFIHLKNNIVTIDCMMSHFELAGIPADGYPKIPVIEKVNPFEIEEVVLKNMIRQTLYAISNDQNKKNFSGTLFQCMDNQLTLVSIDGFRLALARHEVIQNTDPFSVVVPGDTLNEILKILQPEKNKVQLFVTPNLMAFETQNCKIITRLLQTEFLNYKNVIPDFQETKMKIQTKDFLSSLERASLIGLEDKKYPVKFTVKEDVLLITSSATIGNAREVLPVEIFGTGIEIGFNPRFFMEALRVVDEEVVMVHFTSSFGPAVLKPQEGDAFLHMILPVKLSEVSTGDGSS
jgi:DNA polymerase III subunit beta